MAADRPTLIEWVRARMDEVSPASHTAVQDTETIDRELDEAARICLLKAPRELVYFAAEHYTSECFVRFKGSDNISVLNPLPSNFVRFLHLRLHNWTNPAQTVIPVVSPLYQAQSNSYQRVSGDEPLAALIPFVLSYSVTKKIKKLLVDGPVTEGADDTTILTTSYLQAVEGFPAPADLREYTQALVIPSAVLTPRNLKAYRNTGLLGGQKALTQEFVIVRKKVAENMPENLHDPLVWLVASRCLTMLREGEAAKLAATHYADSLNDLLVAQMGGG